MRIIVQMEEIEPNLVYFVYAVGYTVPEVLHGSSSCKQFGPSNVGAQFFLPYQ